MKALTFIVLLSTCLYLVIQQTQDFSNTKNIHSKLVDLYKPLLKKTDSTIQLSYISNISDPAELFFKSQFAIAPYVITRELKNNHLLVLKDKSLNTNIDSIVTVNQYIIIDSSNSDDYTAYLCLKYKMK